MLAIAQRCFWHRAGGLCYLGGGQAMSPCVLCPNWRDRKQDEKGKYRTWFDLPAPLKALTGIQLTFHPAGVGGEGEAESRAGPAGTHPRPEGPDDLTPTVAAGGRPRSLEDW